MLYNMLMEENKELIKELKKKLSELDDIVTNATTEKKRLRKEITSIRLAY
jgi:peptidoglycan hydrolase CwlO-like protein